MADAGAQESEGLPVVLLVGDVAMGQKLLKALAVPSSCLESKDTALGVIKNKYYSARVQYRLVATSAATAAQLEAAEALVLLWDLQNEQLKQLQALFPAEALDDGPDRVQICLAVDGEGVGDAAREWCIDQGFEYLSCTLGNEDLKMLEQRCQQPAASRRTGLLDEDSENSVLRLMEALECHSSWPGRQPIASSPEKPPVESQQPTAEEDAKRNGYTALADAPGKPADSKEPVQIEKVHDRIQDDDFAEADEFEKFAREMKEIREMRDHQSRKDRACDLALRLAASLGVDSDSD